MDVPLPYLINDTRKAESFKKQTYSGFKKQDVLNVLFKKLDENKLSEVCTWCVEIICSGYIEELWDRIINYYVKYISINSPLLSFHFFNKLVQFLRISNDEEFKKNQLDLRNSQEIRNHSCEILCILNNATKRRSGLSLPKISKNEFELNVFQKKLRAKDFSVSISILEINDPKEMNIIANEFAFHISEFHFNIQQAIYWLSWTLDWEKINVIKKGHYNCGLRDVSKSIDNKYKKDFIWIFWEIILKENDSRSNYTLNNQIKSLYEFFKYKYTGSKKKKRINIMICAMELLNPNLKFDKVMIDKYPIFEKYYLILQACANINLLYKELKKEENLENEIINSKIKMEATNVITKYETIQSLQDISIKRQKEKEYIQQLKEEKKLKDRQKKERNKSREHKELYRQQIMDTIDTYILDNSNSRPFHYNPPIENIQNNNSDDYENKTINIIDNIDKKISNGKGKGKGKNKEKSKILNLIKK